MARSGQVGISDDTVRGGGLGKVQGGLAHVSRALIALLSFDPRNLFHALCEELLAAFICGLVIPSPDEAWRQALHIGHASLYIMRVLILLAVVQLLHQLR